MTNADVIRELKEIVERARKATPGEWRVNDPDMNGDDLLTYGVISSTGEMVFDEWSEYAEDAGVRFPRPETAAYICACSPDRLIPLLTAAIEAMATLEGARRGLRAAGANLPVPEIQGTPESGIVSGMSIALALLEFDEK